MTHGASTLSPSLRASVTPSRRWVTPVTLAWMRGGADVGGGVGQRLVQHGPPHAPPRTLGEPVLDPGGRVDVGEAVERAAGRAHADAVQGGQRPGHQPLAARLVDRTDARLDEHDVHAVDPRLDRARQPDRPPADDDDIRVHARAGSPSTVARARFSHRMRTTSSQAFSTVNTRAVIQAVCTSGSAKPSTTTAT